MNELILFLDQNPWIKWILLFLIAMLVWKIVKSIAKVVITTVVIIVIYLFIANVFVPRIITVEEIREATYQVQNICSDYDSL